MSPDRPVHEIDAKSPGATEGYTDPFDGSFREKTRAPAAMRQISWTVRGAAKPREE